MKRNLLLSSILVVLSCQSVLAVDIYTIPTTNPSFQFNIYNQGEQLKDEDGATETSLFTLSENQRQALFDAAKSWKIILNSGDYALDKLPKFAVATDNDFNASAGSGYVNVGEDYLITEINAFINGNLPTSPSEFQGLITVGIGLIEEYPGWNYYTGSTALYQANKPDLYSTMVHEIYHAIGLASNVSRHINGDNTYYFSDNEEDSKISIWDSNLSIYKAPVAKEFFDFNPSSITNAGKGMSVRTDKSGTETFDIVNYSPYFTGLNTLKVLTGKDGTKQQLQEIIYNNGGLKNYSNYYNDNGDWSNKDPLVLGLPVNVIEKGKPELSHIELRNSFMSHQTYQNWAILMEAELAVLKDLGYVKTAIKDINVELRDFFGKSYYLNNNGTLSDPVIFSTGYGKWDPVASEYTLGEYSTVENGIGLHIYGDNNVIIQDVGNTLSHGKYTIGTRIDGVNNNYTLRNSQIDVDGDGSIGIAVAWGKDHTVTINSDATVSAIGKDGIGVSFDFGKNVCGGYADDRGSYSFYDSALNINKKPDVETRDALIDTFNVNGDITGDKAAIYISENAHVKDININNGVTINGDIISKWNSVKSGVHMYVMKEVDDTWRPVDKDNTDEIYFTNLNFTAGNTTVKGNIDGSNDIFNTLKMTNTGILDFSGNDMSIYLLNNTGTINFTSATVPELTIQSGSINGNGTLNFEEGINLANINNISNTVNIGDNTFISLLDGNASKINIDQLNVKDVGLYIDCGDTFILQNASNPGFNTLKLKQIAVNQQQAEVIDETDNVQLFDAAIPETSPITLNIDPDTSANFYYKNVKYTFKQNTTDKSLLSVDKVSGNFGLADAIADPTTGNYIVDTDESMTDLGTVQSEYFEISGDKINLNGHTGLVVDGTKNGKTVLKTDIYGASDSNITLTNNANMIVDANESIKIGEQGETSLTIDNSAFEAEGGSVTFGGKIKGLNTNTNNLVSVTAEDINLDSVENIALVTSAETLNLNNTMTNTIWKIDGTEINILNDSYLSSDGTNTIVYQNGLLNLANNKASDINLKGMTLNADLETTIDVDLSKMQADKFVFANTGDLKTNDNALAIGNINITNTDKSYTAESYSIPFISSSYNNTAFLGHVMTKNVQDIMTPIFKYNLAYNETNTQGNFVLSRGSGSDYNSYNPSVAASSVAAQMGGYLSQLNSYEQAFQNLDMKMLMTREERQAYKMANRYASTTAPKVFSPTYLPEKDKGAWVRPYVSFEKVGLHNGPTVENTSYGTYAGGDSPIYETQNGWDYQYSVYAGYNGSHQNYQGNSIYQNGGTLGASIAWYKKDFFTALTANVGASVAQASTMYGNEDFPMLMTGVASKTGYNWELAKGKFIIQPSYLMSYTFVNTFDYTNAAGVRISSDPLHAINIAPGLKFIGNLKGGWQPYIGMQMVWNIMDETHFKASSVDLPNMSVKPYFQYGVGIQKRWGDRFTGFFQTMIRNGGRNGVALSLGFRWALGKSSKCDETVKNKKTAYSNKSSSEKGSKHVIKN